MVKKLKLLVSCSSDELVKEVYDDVDSKLHPIAMWSLEAHLLKLQEDRVADFYESQQTWSLI